MTNRGRHCYISVTNECFLELARTLGDAGNKFGRLFGYLLFDLGRVRGRRARPETDKLSGAKVRDEITRQVVESNARAQSLLDQIATVADLNKVQYSLFKVLGRPGTIKTRPK